VAICREAVKYAELNGYDTVLLDTAGRLHIDEELMVELVGLKQALAPSEILYVADAMTGQDAVRSAREFHEQVGLTGVILTKMDGDARGGAALSVASVTGVPIKLAGTGEKIGDLEPFHPERMAGRILGMGDVLTLIERAEQTIEADEARKLERKLRRSEFTLEDFRDQLRRLRRMGPLSDILGMLPGASALKGMKDANLDGRELRRLEAIIDSMTPLERRDHTVINGSRKRRIARGSGTSVQEINRLVKQFAQMRRMMRSVASGGRPGAGRSLRLPPGYR
jgi:signal recognition particle subunit SRP54